LLSDVGSKTLLGFCLALVLSFSTSSSCYRCRPFAMDKGKGNDKGKDKGNDKGDRYHPYDEAEGKGKSKGITQDPRSLLVSALTISISKCF
jgi:hypothetical protein